MFKAYKNAILGRSVVKTFTTINFDHISCYTESLFNLESGTIYVNIFMDSGDRILINTPEAEDFKKDYDEYMVFAINRKAHV